MYHRETQSESIPFHIIIPVTIGIIVACIAIFWNFGMYTRVEAGEACTLHKHGEITGTRGPGKHFDPPWGTRYECRDTRPQTAQVGEHENGGQYGRTPVTTITSNGVTVTLTAQVRYATPRESLEFLYEEGARSQAQVWENIVQKEVEKAMRGVANATPIQEVYPEYTDQGEAMAAALATGLQRWGITLDTFTLTSVSPPKEYVDAIQQQQAEVESQRLARAQQETIRAQNENAVLQAQGEADANAARAEGEAQVALIEANAEAESNRIVSESVTQEILTLEYYETLRTISWAIFDVDGVQPITEVPAVPTATPDAG